MMTANIKQEKDANDSLVAAGDEGLALNSTTSKLMADINFLRDRIETMKRFRNPNKATLQNYEGMLRDRESVLAWIQELEASKSALN